MLDKLLNIVHTLEFEEYGGLELIGFQQEGKQFILRLKVWPGEESRWQIWHLTCPDTKSYRMIDRDVTGFQLTDDHVLLWEDTEDESELHLHGKASDARHLAWALYERHQRLANTFVAFDCYLNHFQGGIGLVRLMEGGYGLLARGPLRLLNEYKAVLSEHGVNSYYFTGYGSVLRNERRRAAQSAKIMVALLGKSYIIGSDFQAAMISEGAESV